MPMTPKGFEYVAESSALAVKPGGKVRLPFTIETASGPKIKGHTYTLLGYSVPQGYAIVDVGDDEHLIHPELLEAG